MRMGPKCSPSLSYPSGPAPLTFPPLHSAFKGARKSVARLFRSHPSQLMPASSLLLHRPSSTPPSTPRTGAGGGGFSSSTTAGGSGVQQQPPGGMGSYASPPLVPEDGLHFASLAAALQVGNLGSGGAALTPSLVPEDGLQFASLAAARLQIRTELSMGKGVGPDPSNV